MMNKNITQKIAYFAGIATVIVLLFSLVVPTQVLASKDDWGLGGYGYDDGYYYDDTPVYSYGGYNDDYYYDDTPVYSYGGYNDDYYYDDTPVYSYSNYDYPTYNPVSYSTPSYSTPQYYSVPTYSGSSYRPYTPSYSSPTYIPYTPPVYVPTQSQSNTGVNTNVNSSNSSSNASASSSNTNNNVNNNNNVSNNVNNNNVNIVVGTPISATTNQPQNPSLDGSCYISPSNVQINQDVTFTANASGGNGNYSYSWNGSDGISSGSRTFTGRFYNPGLKTANVTITSGGQSINRSCSVNVEQYYNNNLGVYCIANPTNAAVGQTVVWTAYVTGGNSSYYTYSWYGTDGLSYGNANSIQKSYQTAGSKTATVTVYGNNNQSVSASCNTNITGYIAPISNVTVIRQPTVGTPVSGVYLSQVPETGIAGSMKVVLFALGLIIWSAFVGYILVSRKNNKLALAGDNSGQTAAQRIQAFKLENMRKRGLIK